MLVFFVVAIKTLKKVADMDMHTFIDDVVEAKIFWACKGHDPLQT